MAGLAEGVAARVAYKFYSDADIEPGVAAISSSALGAGSAQVLRRVASTFGLDKDAFQSNEIRPSRQVGDYRHGMGRVPGALSGELSPLTYEQWFEASMRGTWAAAVTASEADFTSVAAEAATRKLTFASGNPVTKGYRIGMGIRFGTLSEALNNSKTFVIVAFGGSNNREVTVHPAPTDMSADTGFTMTSVGRSLIMPVVAANQIKRKLALEHYRQDKDTADLFVEGRVGGFNLQLPASGMSTIEFPALFRDEEPYSGGAAPFFTDPTAQTTTGLLAAVNGMLRINGELSAVVTGLNILHAMELTGDPVVGSSLMPDITTGRSIVTGQITANYKDNTLFEAFRDESEIDILAYLTATSADAAPAMTFYLPRVKLGGAQKPLQGEGPQTITLPFTALEYEGVEATTGKQNTTLQIWDSEVTS